MPLDIQTFSIVIGGPRCDAHCPFCVSKQTGMDEVRGQQPEINWRNLGKAWGLVDRGRTTTVLMTGKGEPLLYPDEISSYLEWFNELYRNDRLAIENFTDGEVDALANPVLPPMPLIELQTNALRIGQLANRPAAEWAEHELTRKLRYWHAIGLDTIAISAVETGTELNSRIYSKDYPKLENTVAYLRQIGFTVRLCIMMLKGGVDSSYQLVETAHWCRDNDVAQLTVRPIRRPASSQSQKASDFVQKNGLDDSTVRQVFDWLTHAGQPILSLAHGATVYDLNGQNICLADCLTNNAEFNQGIRTLIFYSNGRLAYDWQHKGAVILSGWSEKRK